MGANFKTVLVVSAGLLGLVGVGYWAGNYFDWGGFGTGSAKKSTKDMAPPQFNFYQAPLNAQPNPLVPFGVVEGEGDSPTDEGEEEGVEAETADSGPGAKKFPATGVQGAGTGTPLNQGSGLGIATGPKFAGQGPNPALGGTPTVPGAPLLGLGQSNTLLPPAGGSASPGFPAFPGGPPLPGFPNGGSSSDVASGGGLPPGLPSGLPPGFFPPPPGGGFPGDGSLPLPPGMDPGTFTPDGFFPGIGESPFGNIPPELAGLFGTEGSGGASSGGSSPGAGGPGLNPDVGLNLGSGGTGEGTPLGGGLGSPVIQGAIGGMPSPEGKVDGWTVELASADGVVGSQIDFPQLDLPGWTTLIFPGGEAKSKEAADVMSIFKPEIHLLKLSGDQADFIVKADLKKYDLVDDNTFQSSAFQITPSMGKKILRVISCGALTPEELKQINPDGNTRPFFTQLSEEKKFELCKGKTYIDFEVGGSAVDLDFPVEKNGMYLVILMIGDVGKDAVFDQLSGPLALGDQAFTKALAGNDFLSNFSKTDFNSYTVGGIRAN